MNPKERSDIIENALLKAISDLEDREEGDILGDWAVISFVANPDDEKESAYHMFFANGEMPHYRARGLFVTGLAYLKPDDE
jgi:hypothetical protein